MAASSEKAIQQATVSMSDISLSPPQRSEVVVQLRCSDGKEIDLDEATALMSGYVRKRLDYARRIEKWEQVRLKLANDEVLKHIPSDMVERVFHYCRRHAHAQPNEDLEAFDAQLVDLDYPELCKLIRAALRFDIQGLWKRANVAYDMTGRDLNSYCHELLVN